MIVAPLQLIKTKQFAESHLKCKAMSNMQHEVMQPMLRSKHFPGFKSSLCGCPQLPCSVPHLKGQVQKCLHFTNYAA